MAKSLSRVELVSTLSAAERGRPKRGKVKRSVQEDAAIKLKTTEIGKTVKMSGGEENKAK